MKKETYKHILKAIDLGLYKADKKGNVYSCHKLGKRWGRKNSKATNIYRKRSLVKNTNKKFPHNAYFQLNINFNKKDKFVYAHHLIWIYFNRDFDYKLTINHKNRNKLDNRLCNLEELSFKENLKHYLQNGGRKKRKITPSVKKTILDLIKFGWKHRDISKKFDISIAAISKLRNNEICKYI